MGHHPDFWYEAAQFLDQSAKTLTEKGVGDFMFLS
jgi:cleavage stimulation factor subunit 3